ASVYGRLLESSDCRSKRAEGATRRVGVVVERLLGCAEVALGLVGPVLEYLSGLLSLADVRDTGPREPFTQRVVRDLDRAVHGSADDKCALDGVPGPAIISARAVVALAELVAKRLELALPSP